jgi:hypothetical protein
MHNANMLLAAWTAAADNTATGKTLASLKGSALSADLKKLIIAQELSTDDICFTVSASAAGTSPKWPTSVVILDVDKAQADKLRFFCTAGGNLTIVELG